MIVGKFVNLFDTSLLSQINKLISIEDEFVSDSILLKGELFVLIDRDVRHAGRFVTHELNVSSGNREGYRNILAHACFLSLKLMDRTEERVTWTFIDNEVKFFVVT
jgi:hypothetical protein